MIRRHLIVLLGLAALVAPAQAREDRMEPAPAAVKSVDIAEKPNAQVPGALTFTNELGEEIKLSKYFDQGKPIILTLNYYSCPLLCELTLNGMVDCLKNVPLTPGKDYEIVTVSFSPTET